jgi:hypothetical protein
LFLWQWRKMGNGKRKMMGNSGNGGRGQLDE